DRLLAPGQESRLQEAPSRPFVGIRAGYVVERDVAQIPGAISLELASPEVELAELLERQPITTTNGPAEQIRQILCCRTHSFSLVGGVAGRRARREDPSRDAND